jgi:hypothetical protein
MKVASEIPASVANSQFFQKVASNDPNEMQKLGEAVTDFTRVTLRDEGLLRQIIPPESITVADTDKQLDTDKPVKIIEKEVNQPLSASIPFGTLPRNFYMRGKKYRCDFARLTSRNYVADIRQLETYGYDIRNTFKENAIKDMCYAEDIPLFATLNAIVEPTSPAAAGTWAAAGQASMVSPLTGKVQKFDFSHASRNPLDEATGFTRSSFVESFKILTTGYTPSGFVADGGGPADDQTPIRNHVETCLMNVNTALEFAKFQHDEFGGPGAQDLLKSGVTSAEWFGRKFIFTLKDDIVEDGVMWMFAAPEFLGKFYELDAPTMFVDKHAFLIEFFVYSCVGSAIGNPFGVAKVKYF